MDQSVKQAADALATAVARSTSHKDEPTKTYIAMEKIFHDHREYSIGEDVELTDAQAKQLLKLGSVVEKGDKIAAKAIEASKERDKQEIEEAHAKLEARARGEEPNNLGRLVVGPRGETIPMPLDPGYKIVDSASGKQLNVPAGKTETVTRGANVKASARGGAKLEGPVPVQPSQVGGRTSRGRTGATKVSYGKPGSTAGKPPTGGKPKSGKK